MRFLVAFLFVGLMQASVHCQFGGNDGIGSFPTSVVTDSDGNVITHAGVANPDPGVGDGFGTIILFDFPGTEGIQQPPMTGDMGVGSGGGYVRTWMTRGGGLNLSGVIELNEIVITTRDRMIFPEQMIQFVHTSVTEHFKAMGYKYKEPTVNSDPGGSGIIPSEHGTAVHLKRQVLNSRGDHWCWMRIMRWIPRRQGEDEDTHIEKVTDIMMKWYNKGWRQDQPQNENNNG